MKRNSVFKMGLFIGFLGLGLSALAEETKMEKAGTMGDKTVDATKRVYRDAKDKGCEIVNGKMDCTVKKMKHKAQNAMDKIETKATEEKNKVD